MGWAATKADGPGVIEMKSPDVAEDLSVNLSSGFHKTRRVE